MSLLKRQPPSPTRCGAPGAPIINYEGSFIFAGSGQGEETCSFYATTRLCEKHSAESFLFYLNELQRITYMLQAEGWSFLEYEPLGTRPAAAETLIKMQPPLSTSSADIIFYPFNEAVLVLGDRFRDIPA